MEALTEEITVIISGSKRDVKISRDRKILERVFSLKPLQKQITETKYTQSNNQATDVNEITLTPKAAKLLRERIKSVYPDSKILLNRLGFSFQLLQRERQC